MKEIATSISKAFVLTIDYGYSSGELYSQNRRNGTLVCYNKHTVNDIPYYNIGKQDITSHVNFSAIYHWGMKYGLDYCGFTNQVHFLLSLGLNEYLRNMEESTPGKLSKHEKVFFMNTFMRDMGNKLKVLIQQKGVGAQKLSGMKLSLNNL